MAYPMIQNIQESGSQHRCVSDITGKVGCKIHLESSCRPVETVLGKHPDAELCFRYSTSDTSDPDPCLRFHSTRTRLGLIVRGIRGIQGIII